MFETGGTDVGYMEGVREEEMKPASWVDGEW